MSLQWSGNHLIQSVEQLNRKDILVELEKSGDYFTYTVNAPGNLFGGEGGPTSIYSSSMRCRSEAEAKKKISQLKVIEIFHVLWLISLGENNESIRGIVKKSEEKIRKANRKETLIRALIAIGSSAISILSCLYLSN